MIYFSSFRNKNFVFSSIFFWLSPKKQLDRQPNAKNQFGAVIFTKKFPSICLFHRQSKRA